ncbi:hypothetical protein C6500_17950 [Candidatus Poribacteria bacterium]|nr:MAG: hypothetical protein C6500_17950 [Candidatus Poribacteria bacterium]
MPKIHVYIDPKAIFLPKTARKPNTTCVLEQFTVSPKINETLFDGRGDLAPTETEASQYY